MRKVSRHICTTEHDMIYLHLERIPTSKTENHIGNCGDSDIPSIISDFGCFEGGR